MIPYLEIPTLHLGPLEIHAFGVLVAIGILVGADRTRYRARQLGLPDVDTASMITWVVVMGFVVAHVFDVLAYQFADWVKLPLATVDADLVARRLHDLRQSGFIAEARTNLSLFFTSTKLGVLIDPRAGLSSFGGFLGALLALLWFTRHYAYPLLAAADSLLFGLAFGWLFGRLGCYTAHDHPGAFTDFFLAVNYPMGSRHDLGFDEALFAFVLSATFYFLGRKTRPMGLYAALTCLFYAPVRFGLDFLRVKDVQGADPRYFGFTPAQYGCIAVFLAGIGLAIRAAQLARRSGAEKAAAVTTQPPELPQE